MAQIELSAFASDGELSIKAVRRDDEDGSVMLIIEAGDTRIEVNAGQTESDADNLTGQLMNAKEQAADIADNWDDRPSEYDNYVTLDRGRYYVTFSGRITPDDQPRDGYPTGQIAICELARMMADAGEFRASWMTGEHGPVTRSIDNEVRAFHDEGGSKMRRLPGVIYQDGAIVRLAGDAWPTWVVDRDYGAYGVRVHTLGDPGVATLAQHAELTLHPDYDEHGEPKQDGQS